MVDHLLDEVKKGDREATNGGYYVGPDRRDEAENLVEEGKVVRLLNPAGVSPKYVPMGSEHYSDERLERLRKKQAHPASFTSQQVRCPVCGEECNHVVENGYRNRWDGRGKVVEVCTTDDDDSMYVHVTHPETEEQEP